MGDFDYLESTVWEKVNALEGWLNYSAAHFTWMLMKHQRHLPVTGPVVEFGVFKGKYLSLLTEASASTGEKVFGYDGFFSAYNVEILPGDIEQVRQMMVGNVASVVGDVSRLTVVRSNTLKLDASSLLEQIGGQVSFASIDAGHEAHEVAHDLEVISDVLAPGGIIAADDVFNYVCPGVMEGTCRFLDSLDEPKIAPFAAVGNKVFFTTPDHHAHYFDVTKRFVASTDEPYLVATFETMRSNTENGYFPKFFGYEIVPFSG